MDKEEKGERKRDKKAGPKYKGPGRKIAIILRDRRDRRRG